MEAFEYAAWFRDSRLPPDDEDYEWPAAFLLLAASADVAQAWGDHLARAAAERMDGPFLHSTVEPHICGSSVALPEHRCENYMGALPVVADGDEATDQAIGW